MIAEVIAAGAIFVCSPSQVWDGDSFWCAEGPRIRLAGIAAREIDGTCRPHHPCPSASGEAARDGLVALVGRPVGRLRTGHILVRGVPLRCVSEGSGKGERTAAWCAGPQGDLSCALVKDGYALRWPRYWREERCR